MDSNAIIKIIGVMVNGFALGEVIIEVNNTIILNYKKFINRDTSIFKHAKSLFELEKIYQNSSDPEFKTLHETIGFSNDKTDNSTFF